MQIHVDSTPKRVEQKHSAALDPSLARMRVHGTPGKCTPREQVEQTMGAYLGGILLLLLDLFWGALAPTV